MATSRSAESVGRVLGGRYRLTRPLGVGASAHVYAAEDVQLRRRVAVKVLHPALAGEEAFLRRFLREAQAVAGLRHPSILRVYDWGEDDGSPYLVMELLDGGSLRSMLDQGILLTPAQAASVGAAAARALAYAHRQGIVHRDIKPANLIFDEEGRVSVADFGLARALAEAAWTEPTGAVVGTARYASPELVRGEKLDARADVYSLAIVLTEATTGEVPFAADTAMGTLLGRVGRSLEVPDQAGPLKEVLEAAGRMDPGERLDAAGLAAELDRVAASMAPPGPLPLVSPLRAGVVERDDVSPTDYPGRPRLFDAAEWPDGGSGQPTATEAAGVTRTAGAAGLGYRDAAAGPDADVVVTGRERAGRERAGRPAGDSRDQPGRAAGTGDPAVAAGTDPAAEPRPRRRMRRILAVAAVVVLLLAGGGTAWAVLSGRLEPTHPVPRLVGDPRASAATTLQRLHFKLAVSGSDYSPRFPAGAVLTQSPATGKLREGSTVTVVLSLGPRPVPVPNLANDTQQAAEQVIASLGLKVGQVTPQHSMTVGAGIVIASTPDSGTLLPGAPVNLVVSSGKPQVAIPAIDATDGASYAAASAALSAAGLGATQTSSYSDNVQAGHVIAFSPGSGTTVTVGTVVTVEVSKGPHVVNVPDVRGMSVGAASQAVSAAGLSVSGVSGNPLATVVGTNPAVGQQVHFGSSVVLITG
ncbi:MAG TPA: PASTA domain-containing protein [Acidimicrobiales bacterium]|nr:PASTA domain-containing protein [Acidimicrobiales bacterium]